MPTVAHASLTGANLHEPKGADAASANSVYVSDGAGSGDWTSISLLVPAASSFGTVSCRLTALSGTAITDADQTNVNTLYMIPMENNNIALYDGSTWQIRTYAQTSTTLDTSAHLANTNYSMFAYWDGSTVKIGSGPAWISDTSTGTGSSTSEVELFEGRLVNKNAIILRINGANSSSIPARQALLIGGFRCYSAALTEDSQAKRFVSNVYNKYPRSMEMIPTTQSYTPSTAGVTTFREANNGSGIGRCEVFFVTGGNPVDLDLYVVHICDTANVSTAFGIGQDSTSVNSANHMYVVAYSVANSPFQYVTNFSGNPTQGYHYYAWLEATGTSGTRTVYSNLTSTRHQSCLTGLTFN